MNKVAVAKLEDLEDRKPAYALVGEVDLVVVRFGEEVLTLDERAVTQAAQDVTEAMWARFHEQEKGVEMPFSDSH